ncbi:SAR2788 family putative toxin [Staphylococcus aureus]|uniref:SAR2788 family putative toxin n=1 Tax=Staphylococcus aureus TaxID=1280 RepID=UPI0024815AC5|nr:SAR2788 family putative toxin [Staphylococcus aureus]MDI0201693.1 SAR2788 family putative toxin [Staphylococcus aureus]MDI0355681.1 SAR2788 family putative toxin [Staphylococcus aureus]
MKIYFSKLCICTIIISLILSGVGSSNTDASNKIIKENIEVNESVKNTKISENKIGEVSRLSTSINNNEINLDTVLTNDFNAGDINLSGKISNVEESKQVDYTIDLTYADEEDIAGFLIDNSTGEEHEFDTRLAEASAAPLVVVAVMAARYGIQWAIKKYGKKAVNNAIKSNTHKVAKGINSRLLTSKGVDIGKFTQKVKGKNPVYRDLKTGWSISRNKGEPHGGSYWKLLDKSGTRKATLTKDGKILRK